MQDKLNTIKKAEKVVNLLKKSNYTISFAESCTGGKAVAGIIDIPSTSSVLHSSFVTYANEAKINLLNVNPDTIEKFGVVSEQVVREMAIGVANKSQAQVGVGISGIAGPDGGTANKPVGMVCFGFYIDGKLKTKTQYFGDIGRNNVRDASVDFAYDTLIELLSQC